MKDLQDAVQRLNTKLSTASIPVRVRVNGNYLVLRATLPLKPGEGTGRRQRDVSLGIPANKDGLRRAENEAKRLGAAIALDKFSWNDYQKPSTKVQDGTIAQLVEAFKVEYMSRNRLTEATWRENWQRTFDRLPQDEPLTEALTLAVVLSTENHTRSRELTCQRLQRLADFAGLAIDLKPYRGEYGEQSTEPRDIPPESLIEEYRDRIPNPAWQWVFGMLATFGLRPHEAFKCEFVDAVTVKVLTGKTGGRLVRAIPPQWIEQWNLHDIDRPNVQGRNYRDYGQRCSRQFSRYDLPIVPYDLRHAYAIRGSVVNGLPVSTMAAMMGHSVAVHTRIYHRWLSDATNEAVYRRLILEED